MKKTHYITTIIPAMLIANVLVINIAKSQEPPSDVIKRAMKDELSRNISNLTLEGVQKPYFISYTICDAKTLRISATLGSLISSVETPVREHLTDVFVGDYQRDNQNFFDINILAESYQENSSLPLDNDYFGIRRGLWLSTDKKYKAAAELLEAKLSAIKQQNLSEEEASLPDFSKATTVVSDLPSLKFNIDKSKWENIAKELSTAFKNYKNIYSSNVSVFIYQSDIYFLNSEGTETKVPFTIAAVRINAQTQADDGEPLADHLLYYSPTPDDLPSIETMKNDVKIMADNLLTLRNAPVFNDSYTGPVLFENQAVAEVFAQQFFSGKSCLIAKRKPVYSDPKMLFYMGQLGAQSMDDKIGKPLVSKDMNIKSTPFISDFEGTKLIGSYQVDGDGVKPATELVLIENGTLKNLLNDRTPTPKIRESNGHKRLALQIGGGISTDAGPGIININAGKGMTPVKL
ncbi:MAG: hypothetical protein HY738_05410, partial [Bacteroidia bacterium]|nr:hypothetical protein [Bacteroidia bacterium]